MNEQNLIPLGRGRRTKAEETEIKRKGGKISGANRRKRKEARELMQILAALPANELEAEALETLGIDADDRNQLTITLLALLRKAQNGDVRSVETVLSLLGELPPKAQEIAVEGEKQGVVLILPDNGRD